jgi:YHS domain-containing protein
LTKSTTTQDLEFRTACGGTLKNPTNYPKSVYKGREVYFCTLACFRAFENDPDPFMAGEVKHPIGEEKEGKGKSI